MKEKLNRLLQCIPLLGLGVSTALGQSYSTSPSSGVDPYYKPSPTAAAAGYRVNLTSILTVQDPVVSDIGGYRMVGIPDGLGVLDNGDGTFELFVNHELSGGEYPGGEGRPVYSTNANTGVITTNIVGAAAGAVRAHGGKGAFVSAWQIQKADLKAIHGADLIQSGGLFLWDISNATYRPFDPVLDLALSRFCSADLPKSTAFYNPATGKGTQTRYFLNGEEISGGRAFAHTLTGPDKGKSYELPRLGKFAWENSVACPTPQDVTLVMGNNDGALGGSILYAYIGQKGTTGTDLDKAGLTSGDLYAVVVNENGQRVVSEDIANALGGSAHRLTQAPFTLYRYGDATTYPGNSLDSLGATNATGFFRIEDGAWDPTHPQDYYFVTTGRASGKDVSHPTRLWRLHFDDLSHPELGGLIEMIAEGAYGTGQAAATANPVMWDNLCILPDGLIVLQEDPGGNARLAKVWLLNPQTKELVDLASADPRVFASGASRFRTIDEESSGVIDASEILGPGWILFDVQAHYEIPGELVEGGQLIAMHLEREALHFASTEETPYYIATPELAAAGGFHSVTYSLVTVGEGSPQALAGIPDGLGALDNGDGTFTLVVNHELVGGIVPGGQGIEVFTTNIQTGEIKSNLVGQAVGETRAYGGKGAFVSQWTVNRTNLQFSSGKDLIQSLYLYEGGSYRLFNPQADYHLSRFCSADLPAPTAFYNPDNGKGTEVRLYLNGEEDNRVPIDSYPGQGGRAFAHTLTGANAGKSYELPWLGKFAWENAVACPVPQDKTVVIGLDDSGLTNSQVYVYVGNKQNTGLDIEKAGLTNGKLFGIRVTSGGKYLQYEDNLNVLGTSQRVTKATFALYDLGDVVTKTDIELDDLSVKNCTSFQRCEDGAWDPTHPNDFYFITTGRASGNDVSNATRLWRLCFFDVMRPENGGTIEMVLEGAPGVGAAASNSQPVMMDNLTVSWDGTVVIQEDPGNNARLSKIWHFNPFTQQLTCVAEANPRFFKTGADRFLTRDEESSGIIDASSLLGPGWYLFDVQAHYAITNSPALVEGGQLQALHLIPVEAYPSIRIPPASQTIGIGGSVTLSVTPAGTGPFSYQWFQNGVQVPGAVNATFTLYNQPLNQVGTTYTVAITGPDGTVTSAPATIKVNPADPKIGNPALFAGMVFQGTPQAQYRVEYSSLVNTNWQTLTNLTLPSTPYLFIDATATSQTAQRFYRLVVP